MAWFKLIAMEQQLSQFISYCGQPQVLPQQAGYVYFKWEAPSLNPEILELVRAQNRAGQSCLYWELKPYRAIFFDMDSTVIAEESIVELAKFAGTDREVQRVTELAMEGKLDFNQALEQRVATLKGQTSEILQAVSQRLTINPGMAELCQLAKSQNLELYLISGGFHELAEYIATQLCFDGFRANYLERDNGILTGKVSGTIINAAEKLKYVKEICQQKSFSSEDIIAIGDGANDLPMLAYAGLSLGYRPKDVLLPHVNGAIYDSYVILKEVIQPLS